MISISTLPTMGQSARPAGSPPFPTGDFALAMAQVVAPEAAAAAPDLPATPVEAGALPPAPAVDAAGQAIAAPGTILPPTLPPVPQPADPTLPTLPTQDAPAPPLAEPSLTAKPLPVAKIALATIATSVPVMPDDAAPPAVEHKPEVPPQLAAAALHRAPMRAADKPGPKPKASEDDEPDANEAPTAPALSEPAAALALPVAEPIAAPHATPDAVQSEAAPDPAEPPLAVIRSGPRAPKPLPTLPQATADALPSPVESTPSAPADATPVANDQPQMPAHLPSSPPARVAATEVGVAPTPDPSASAARIPSAPATATLAISPKAAPATTAPAATPSQSVTVATSGRGTTPSSAAPAAEARPAWAGAPSPAAPRAAEAPHTPAEAPPAAPVSTPGAPPIVATPIAAPASPPAPAQPAADAPAVAMPMPAAERREAPVTIAIAPIVVPPAPAQPQTPQPAAQVFAAAMFAAERPAAARRESGDPAADLAAAFPLSGLGQTAPAPLAVHAAHAPAGAGLDMTDDGWMSQMIDRIETLTAEGGARETRLRLSPDALGQVDVAIRHDANGAVEIRIAAESPQARQILADAAPRLAELAEQRGLKLGGSGVDAGAANTNTQSGSNGREGNRPAPFAPRSALAANDDGAAVTDTRLA